ncbi:MAG: hypothetical protein JWQ90_5254 [Hydrocarboniphaga sp.]|uniref:nucleotidyltransferase domain-containing protein n=1 Tax=Hydrocarboniphaga sp. TaxID=2033016 RepID=UPI00260A3445|nr:nucleotidyltransferase domain-containing protein [Hydrocarboniphaga sp.]MDB5972804.1 hypothetical protein [Hydrocarboniphaga sp.]
MTDATIEPATLEDLPATVVSRIRERLTQLEQTHRVKVLHAIESGSRAWGFASPDSDYDGRFIYVNEPDWYFSVNEARDVIETPIEDEGGVVFDVNGWDLRKALRLLAKSNPVLIEWLQSPIVYAAMPQFAAEMLELARQFHSPKAAHYHYFHMARKNFREHLCGERVRLKKYFYVIRPVLACLWIERGMGIPPMTLTALLDGVLPQGVVRDDILRLRLEKIRTPEFGEGPPLPAIQSFLSAEIERLSAIAVPGQVPTEISALDRFLRKWARANG